MTLHWNRKKTAVAAIIATAGLWTAGQLRAFNPQPDPPAFAAMQMLVSETATLYSRCSDDSIFGVNPGPCVVDMKFEDQAGNTLKEVTVTLRPGQTGFLQLQGSEVGRSAAAVIFQPCLKPSLGGRVFPAVQVTDTLTGKTSFFANPVSPRMSFFGF